MWTPVDQNNVGGLFLSTITNYRCTKYTFQIVKVDWLASGVLLWESNNVVLVFFTQSWHTICKSYQPIRNKGWFMTKFLNPANQGATKIFSQIEKNIQFKEEVHIENLETCSCPR
jgi:hypothetical protein